MRNNDSETYVHTCVYTVRLHSRLARKQTRTATNLILFARRQPRPQWPADRLRRLLQVGTFRRRERGGKVPRNPRHIIAAVVVAPRSLPTKLIITSNCYLV